MEKNRCEVFLVSVGPEKIEVIKVIREYTDLGLKEAKELAESAPRVVWSDVPRDEAENMKRDLENAGAIAEIRGDSGFGWNTQDSDNAPRYVVFLHDPGSKKIEAIKIVRNYTGLGLKEAKELVESAPRTVCSGISREAAENMKTELDHAGALAEITGGSAFGWSPKDSDSSPGYAVILVDLGPQKIEVIKVIRAYTDLGLKEAKDLAESAPGTVCSGVTREVAEDMKRDLENAGATAQIKSS
jgi:large subunit ribosomal protein L7/L12